MDRNTKLRLKANEIEKWAIEECLLKNGEFITVTISITKRPVLYVRFKQRNNKEVGTKITTKEWASVFLAADLNDEQREFLQKLQNNKNQPLRSNSFESRRGLINKALSKVRLPYQLRAPGRGENYNGNDPVILVKIA